LKLRWAGAEAVSTLDSLDQDDSPETAAAISSALERLWVKFLPEIRARVEVLEAAAVALAAGTLSGAQRESATSAAHKLAGTLGTFSLAHGTVVARELEQLYASGDGPSPEVAAQTAQELREMIEGRSDGQDGTGRTNAPAT
jgi:HPt (histidine-containing phosphotransfer) domain-containing protein